MVLTCLACRRCSRLWISYSCTRKTQQRGPQTWSHDCTSSVCLGGVSGDGRANYAWVQVSRGYGTGKELNHCFFVLWHVSSFRLENLFSDRQRSHEPDNLLKTTLMERPRSCKSYLIARLATCCKYLQKTSSPENNNLDLILQKLGACLLPNPTVGPCCRTPFYFCRIISLLSSDLIIVDFSIDTHSTGIYLEEFLFACFCYIFVLFITHVIMSLEYSFVEIKCWLVSHFCIRIWVKHICY